MTDEALEIFEKRIADETRIGTVVASVDREAIRWMWPGRLAIGKISILDGDPGLGKSTLIASLIARLTTGREWPGEPGGDYGPAEAGNAVIVTVEDDIGSTIRPRLEESGADLSRVTVVDTITKYDAETEKSIEDVPKLPEDLGYLAQAILQADASLLVIDPLTAHLGSEINSFRDQDIRSALAPLAKLADRMEVAVLVVRHLNKQAGGNPMYRGGGSIGIIGAARLGMLLGASPDDDGSLVLTSTKSNLSRLPQSLSLRITPSPTDTSVGIAIWAGTSPHSAYDVLNTKAPRATPEQDKATDWLREMLTPGPLPAAFIYEKAEEAGVSERTLKRAKSGIAKSDRTGGFGDKGFWYWYLNDTEVSDDQKEEIGHRIRKGFDFSNLSSKGATTNENASEKGGQGSLYIPIMAPLDKSPLKHTLDINDNGTLRTGGDEAPF